MKKLPASLTPSVDVYLTFSRFISAMSTASEVARLLNLGEADNAALEDVFADYFNDSTGETDTESADEEDKDKTSM